MGNHFMGKYICLTTTYLDWVQTQECTCCCPEITRLLGVTSSRILLRAPGLGGSRTNSGQFHAYHLPQSPGEFAEIILASSTWSKQRHRYHRGPFTSLDRLIKNMVIVSVTAWELISHVISSRSRPKMGTVYISQLVSNCQSHHTDDSERSINIFLRMRLSCTTKYVSKRTATPMDLYFGAISLDQQATVWQVLPAHQYRTWLPTRSISSLPVSRFRGNCGRTLKKLAAMNTKD